MDGVYSERSRRFNEKINNDITSRPSGILYPEHFGTFSDDENNVRTCLVFS